MALSSSSTDTEVLAQFDDNAAFWESNTKAANLLEAIIIMIRRFPTSQAIAGRSLSMESLENLRNELTKKVLTQSSSNRSNFTKGIPK